MTKDELLEALLVERHLPLPAVPKEGVPYDDPKVQEMRRIEIDTAVESFDHEQRNKKRRAAARPLLVKKGLTHVPRKSTAA